MGKQQVWVLLEMPICYDMMHIVIYTTLRVQLMLARVYQKKKNLCWQVSQHLDMDLFRNESRVKENPSLCFSKLAKIQAVKNVLFT